MFNQTLVIRKNIGKIKKLIAELDFTRIHNVENVKTVNDLLDETNKNRDEILFAFASMDEVELERSFSFMGQLMFDNQTVEESGFKQSLLKFHLYEIMLYVVSNLISLKHFQLVYKIVSNNYYVSKYQLSAEIESFFGLFGMEADNACNLKDIVDEDEHHCILSLITKRLNKDLATLDEIVSCEIIIHEIAILLEKNYFPYAAIRYIESKPKMPRNALAIRKMVENDDTSIALLFGCKTTEELKKKITSRGRDYFMLLHSASKPNF